MLKISLEEEDKIFHQWIVIENHRINLLMKAGFNREEAIEMLKIFHLDCIEEQIRYNMPMQD